MPQAWFFYPTLTGMVKSYTKKLESILVVLLLCQVQAVESLLADAVTISESLLRTCGGQCQSWSVEQFPCDTDLDLTGVPGLKGMVDELR